mmetsp:Transcript_8078/g.12497  ORF Transcript_8078/g.12497 Transcript_8078/m.12497 type:complete len:285 (+) Transcript_8078:238-1092(+)
MIIHYNLWCRVVDNVIVLINVSRPVLCIIFVSGSHGKGSSRGSRLCQSIGGFHSSVTTVVGIEITTLECIVKRLCRGWCGDGSVQDIAGMNLLSIKLFVDPMANANNLAIERNSSIQTLAETICINGCGTALSQTQIGFECSAEWTNRYSQIGTKSKVSPFSKHGIDRRIRHEQEYVICNLCSNKSSPRQSSRSNGTGCSPRVSTTSHNQSGSNFDTKSHSTLETRHDGDTLGFFQETSGNVNSIHVTKGRRESSTLFLAGLRFSRKGCSSGTRNKGSHAFWLW